MLAIPWIRSIKTSHVCTPVPWTISGLPVTGGLPRRTRRRVSCVHREMRRRGSSSALGVGRLSPSRYVFVLSRCFLRFLRQGRDRTLQSSAAIPSGWLWLLRRVRQRYVLRGPQRRWFAVDRRRFRAVLFEKLVDGVSVEFAVFWSFWPFFCGIFGVAECPPGGENCGM